MEGQLVHRHASLHCVGHLLPLDLLPRVRGADDGQVRLEHLDDVPRIEKHVVVHLQEGVEPMVTGDCKLLAPGPVNPGAAIAAHRQADAGLLTLDLELVETAVLRLPSGDLRRSESRQRGAVA